MATFDADYIQRLDQQAETAQHELEQMETAQHELEQMETAQHELDKADQLGRQTITMSDMVAPSLASMVIPSLTSMVAPSLTSTMQGFATRVLEHHRTTMQRAAEKAARPLISTTLQDITKSMATAHVSSYQNLAGGGLAQHQRVMQERIADAAEPLMSRFQDVTQLAATTQLGSFQNLAPQFATAQLGNMNGLSTSMLEAQLRPMNKMAELLLQAKLQPMQSLALGLAQPYALRDSPFMSVFNNLDTTFERFNRLASSSAFSMLQGFQAQQGSLLANQVAKAVSEAARTFPAWGQLSATLRDYQLRDVWIAPMPREGTATEPLLDEVQHTHETNNTEVQDLADEMPFQLNGNWSILQPLQPVENILHSCLRNSPLIVQVLILGPIFSLWDGIVIMVVKDGIIYLLQVAKDGTGYLLHYFC